MVRSLESLSQQNLSRLETVIQDHEQRLETIRGLLRLEGHLIELPIAWGLRHAETIAEHRVRAASSARASWRKLPLELWDRIFASYLLAIRHRSSQAAGMMQKPGRYGHTKQMDEEGLSLDLAAMNAPCLLRRVCSAWRQAVAASPSIWSNIVIDITSKKTPIGVIPFVSSSRASYICSRLEKVAFHHVPWSFSIYENNTAAKSSSDDLLPISSFFRRYASTIELVDRFKLYAYTFDAIHLENLHLPAVSSVVMVSCSNGSRSRYRAMPNTRITKAVLINSLELSTGNVPQILPWHQLTHLTVGGGDFSGENMRGVLQLCTSLRKACFFIDYILFSDTTPKWYDELPKDTTTLTCLEHLTILDRSDHDETFRLPLDNLIFPSLSTLRIFGSYIRDTPVAHYMQPFSGVTCLSLVVSSCEGSGHGGYEMAAIVDGCPRLVELVLYVEDDYPRFLSPLILHPNKPRARHLKRLTLLCNPSAFTNTQGFFWHLNTMLEILRDIVSSRTASSPPADTLPSSILELLILRITGQAAYPGAQRPQPHFQKEMVREVELKIAKTLEEFAGKEGLQLSLEVTDQVISDFAPFPSGKHWDHGAMDFIDDHWELTTSLAPPS